MNLRKTQGFTLIELVVVIAIIGVLASIALPKYMTYRERSQILLMATDLKSFEKGFITYNFMTGGFPNDCHLPAPDNLPPGAGMENYLEATRWSTSPYLGGNYNWEGPDSYAYAGISLFNTTATTHQLRILDSMLDDGNLNLGKFRQTSNGRYTFIIDE